MLLAFFFTDWTHRFFREFSLKKRIREIQKTLVNFPIIVVVHLSFLYLSPSPGVLFGVWCVQEFEDTEEKLKEELRVLVGESVREREEKERLKRLLSEESRDIVEQGPNTEADITEEMDNRSDDTGPNGSYHRITDNHYGTYIVVAK